MTKGYLLKAIEPSDRNKFLYIPECEDVGPISFEFVDDKYEKARIAKERDEASEIAVAEGRSAAYERLREFEIPLEVLVVFGIHLLEDEDWD